VGLAVHRVLDVVVEERLELVLAWQLVQRGLEVNLHHLAVAVLHAGGRMLVGVSTLSERGGELEERDHEACTLLIRELIAGNCFKNSAAAF